MNVDLSGAHTVVEIDGQVYDSWQDRENLRKVSVELTRDKSSEAQVEILDPEFKITDRHMDATGLRRVVCRIWMGFGECSDLGTPLYEGHFARYDHDG